MKLKRVFAAFLSAAVLTVTSAAWAQVGGGPQYLRVESQVNPLAIGAADPRFSWVVEGAGGGQTAYRIVAASSPEALARGQGDIWDSGRVASDETVQIPYAGKALASNQQVFWQVTTWNGANEAKSPVASFSMGILQPVDWKAKWIAFPNDDSMRVMEPDPCFRKEFAVAKPIKRAVVHICGLGQYEMMLNGERVGDHQIAPSWTQYQKTVDYDTYDVTSQLAQGPNAIGVMLGNGMYNCLKVAGRYSKNNNTWGFPKLIMQLEIEYTDGTHAEINTDDSWKTARGPMLVDQEYGGEDYDARREFPGWDKPGFKEDGWSAVALTQAPGDHWAAGSAPGDGAGTAQLIATINPPSKIMKVYEPVKVTQSGNGWVYDFGQNLSGWTHIKVKGPAGMAIKLTPGETAGRGGVSQQSAGVTARSGPTFFTYTLRGDPAGEDWRPKFMYYGFRYVLVQGASPANEPGDGAKILGITSEWVYADAPVAGKFDSSDITLNRIHTLIDGAIKSNMQSVLTDCPHREKLGWLEQSHLMADAISANYDISNLYAKMCRDMRDAQTPPGLIPSTAPQYVVFGPKDFVTPAQGYDDSPEWGSAGVIDAWDMYQTYGDMRTLAAQYDTMKKYVAYLGTRSHENIVSHGLGDWFDIGPRGPGPAQLTTRGLTATAVYYQDIEIIRKTAAMLHRTEDVKTYTDLGAQVRASFNNVFYNPATGQYERGSQTADAMPLVVGLVEPGNRAKVLANLVAAVRDNDNHVTAGDVGFSYVVRALTDGLKGEVMYDMTVNPTGPGYVAQLNSGATTLTEGWDGSHSRNHLMLGHAEAWLYRGLGGIQNAPGSIAYKQIIIRAEIIEKLTSEGPTKWVHVSYNSSRGMIVSNWELAGKKLTMDVTIPATSTATIYVPAADPNAVVATGMTQGLALTMQRAENGDRVFAAKAGTYKFVSTLP